MRAGQLRNRVTIQRNTPSIDPYGQQIAGWQPIAKVWMDIHQLTGKELEAAQQIKSQTTWRGVMRATSGLTIQVDDRVLYGTHTFDITAVVDAYERHQSLQLDLAEAV